MKGSDLAPGTYSSECFVGQLSKRVTSLRGPYDLYTGERDKPLTTGHYVKHVSNTKTVFLPFLFRYAVFFEVPFLLYLRFLHAACPLRCTVFNYRQTTAFRVQASVMLVFFLVHIAYTCMNFCGKIKRTDTSSLSY